MSIIHTFESRVKNQLIEGAGSSWSLVDFVRSHQGARAIGDPSEPVGSVNAEINADHLAPRWIARCPGKMGGRKCFGAEYVSLEHRVFMCHNCWNHDNAGFWLAVIVPSRSDREEIERLLSVRPVAAMNWKPGESLAEIEAENRARGVG